MIHHLCVGIDVSKDTLDVAWTLDGSRFTVRQFQNDLAGFEQIRILLTGMAEASSWRVALEATSTYHRSFVRCFGEAGVNVLVLNPKQSRDLAKGLGILRKNDATDAQVLALCAKLAWREPEALADAGSERLQDLSRRIDVLVRARADEKKRLAKPGNGAEVCASIGRHVLWLGDEIERLEREWLEGLGACHEIQGSYVLALGVPGVGPKTARVVVSELCASQRPRTVKQFVAYAGLAPHERTSGTSLNKRSRTLSTGNKRLRTALYMGAVSLLKADDECRELYLRIVEQGKPAKVAHVAVMNKMMRRIASVLIRKTPWVST